MRRAYIYLAFANSGRDFCIVGKQSMESWYQVCDVPNTFRSRCRHSEPASCKSDVDSCRLPHHESRFLVPIPARTERIPLVGAKAFKAAAWCSISGIGGQESRTLRRV